MVRATAMASVGTPAAAPVTVRDRVCPGPIWLVPRVSSSRLGDTGVTPDPSGTTL